MRTVVLRQPAKTEEQGIAALAQLAASELPTAFNTLEQAIGDSRYHRTETNHIFFRLLAPLCITTAKLEQAIGALLPQYASLIKQVQAYEVELVLPIWEPGKTNVPPRSTRVICRLAGLRWRARGRLLAPPSRAPRPRLYLERMCDASFT